MLLINSVLDQQTKETGSQRAALSSAVLRQQESPVLSRLRSESHQPALSAEALLGNQVLDSSVGVTICNMRQFYGNLSKEAIYLDSWDYNSFLLPGPGKQCYTDLIRECCVAGISNGCEAMLMHIRPSLFVSHEKEILSHLARCIAFLKTTSTNPLTGIMISGKPEVGQKTAEILQKGEVTGCALVGQNSFQLGIQFTPNQGWLFNICKLGRLGNLSYQASDSSLMDQESVLSAFASAYAL